jgi:hypothetical protein
MELTDTQLNYFVNNRLKLPKGKRTEYLAPSWPPSCLPAFRRERTSERQLSRQGTLLGTLGWSICPEFVKICLSGVPIPLDTLRE